MSRIPLTGLLALFVLIAPGPAAAQSPLGDPMNVGVQLVAEGFTAPVTLVEPPDGTGRLFVVDQVGLIRVLMPDGTLSPVPFLDLRSRIVPLMASFDERG